MSKKINVLFGTETGNAEDLANRFTETAEKQGFEVVKTNVEEVNLDRLKSMQNTVVVISTWGDGEPPTTAEDFCISLSESQDLDLSEMNYTVLALGDTNYPEFCATGKQIDSDFSRLGAKAFLERKDLDTDFDYHYDEWEKAVLESLATIN